MGHRFGIDGSPNQKCDAVESITAIRPLKECAIGTLEEVVGLSAVDV